MKDLLSLDAISTGTLPGSEEASEEVRPLRKQQVKEIQGLLQDVDQVNSKLKAMLKKIQEEKQRKEEQRKKQEMDERAKQPQPSAQEETPAGAAVPESDRSKQASSPKASDMWRSMKLKPKFEMAQTRDSIILQAHIPGMNDDDIEIERDDDGQSFTIKGVRVPTPAEEAAMRRQLKSMLARDPWGLYYPQDEKEKDLLMRMGAGRYGSFSETFEVSPEMDLFNISASYAGGVLRVVVPVQQQQPQRQQRQRKAKPAYRQAAPRYHQDQPYGAPQRRRHSQPRYETMGGGGPQQGFFGDRSFWW
jgi:HSP20 family molecular chaperone IbpA